MIECLFFHPLAAYAAMLIFARYVCVDFSLRFHVDLPPRNIQNHSYAHLTAAWFHCICYAFSNSGCIDARTAKKKDAMRCTVAAECLRNFRNSSHDHLPPLLPAVRSNAAEMGGRKCLMNVFSHARCGLCHAFRFRYRFFCLNLGNTRLRTARPAPECVACTLHLAV